MKEVKCKVDEGRTSGGRIEEREEKQKQIEASSKKKGTGGWLARVVFFKNNCSADEKQDKG